MWFHVSNLKILWVPLLCSELIRRDSDREIYVSAGFAIGEIAFGSSRRTNTCVRLLLNGGIPNRTSAQRVRLKTIYWIVSSLLCQFGILTLASNRIELCCARKPEISAWRRQLWDAYKCYLGFWKHTLTVCAYDALCWLGSRQSRYTPSLGHAWRLVGHIFTSHLIVNSVYFLYRVRKCVPLAPVLPYLLL